MGKASFETNNKASRQKQRLDLGCLRDLIVTAKTKRIYDVACCQFFSFLEKQGLKIPAEPDDFDTLVSEYVCFLWEDGDSRSVATNLLSGLQHHVPFLKHKLPSS